MNRTSLPREPHDGGGVPIGQPPLSTIVEIQNPGERCFDITDAVAETTPVFTAVVSAHQATP